MPAAKDTPPQEDRNEMVTHTGQKLIEQWQIQRKRLGNAQRELERVERAEAAAAAEVAKWLAPIDIRSGEAISVWYMDGIITVHCDDQGNLSLSIRKRGLNANLNGPETHAPDSC